MRRCFWNPRDLTQSALVLFQRIGIQVLFSISSLPTSKRVCGKLLARAQNAASLGHGVESNLSLLHYFFGMIRTLDEKTGELLVQIKRILKAHSYDPPCAANPLASNHPRNRISRHEIGDFHFKIRRILAAERKRIQQIPLPFV